MSFNIVIELYRYKMHILHGIDDKQYRRYFKDHFSGLDTTEDRHRSLAYFEVFEQQDGYSECVIHFPRLKILESITHNLIAHEVSHAVAHIINFVGIKPDSTNDEPAAYLYGHIVETIYKRLFQCK